ncbi:hypothetical protein OSB04_019582 [Centaurea solstitialis]|uniref:CCHC-type domain-containing protein n=1 Tax=Centaurea solstitialis TaxID=347529 RepID=A0AA38WEE5_9ASTR|nr:hypothetical protein OSB04_019582 [Centaurea solstitialis]
MTQRRAAPQPVVAASTADHKTTRPRHQLGGGGRTPKMPRNHRGRTTSSNRGSTIEIASRTTVGGCGGGWWKSQAAVMAQTIAGCRSGHAKVMGTAEMMTVWIASDGGVALAAAARPSTAGCLTVAPSGGGSQRIQTTTTNHLRGSGIRRHSNIGGRTTDRLRQPRWWRRFLFFPTTAKGDGGSGFFLMLLSFAAGGGGGALAPSPSPVVASGGSLFVYNAEGGGGGVLTLPSYASLRRERWPEPQSSRRETKDTKALAPRAMADPASYRMASTVTSTNNLSLRSILEKDKLTGPNFLDWERNLMIVLRHERKLYVLEEPLGEAPPANAPAAARNAHKKYSDDLLDVACLMLATMSTDLQAGLINTNAYDMIRQLRDMFQTQARTERYDATKAFNECKMIKGTSVSDHVMKMKRHLDHLERLGHPVPLQLATDTILNSLSDDYKPFVVNYNMNNMEKSIAELHSLLKTAELNMGTKNKTKDVLMIRDGGVKKKNGHTSTSKGKGPVQAVQSAPKKGKGKGKGKKVKPNKARTENRCFTCNEVGHWRQNCPKRHEAGASLGPCNQGGIANLHKWESGNKGLGYGEQLASVVQLKSNPCIKISGRAQKEARQNLVVVTGMFLLNNHPASVLFDSGTDRSYVSLEFRPKIDKRSQKLKEEHLIAYSSAEKVKANKVLKKCTLSFVGRDFSIDLIPIKIGSFHIIVGMDWMSDNQAKICCAEKIVLITLYDGSVLEVHGEKPKRDINIVSYMKMRSHLRRECVTFLAHVVDKEVKEKRIQDLPILRDFHEVFPKELSELPPHRQVEFHIDLIPGASPVAKSPYRLAPSEMQELSDQLQQLLDKGFIRPSSSPWRAPVLFVKKKDGSF